MLDEFTRSGDIVVASMPQFNDLQAMLFKTSGIVELYMLILRPIASITGPLCGAERKEGHFGRIYSLWHHHRGFYASLK